MKTTPFTEKHISLGAKMHEFAGYNMPIEYSGIIDEHLTVCQGVGVFDVSLLVALIEHNFHIFHILFLFSYVVYTHIAKVNSCIFDDFRRLNLHFSHHSTMKSNYISYIKKV